MKSYNYGWLFLVGVLPLAVLGQGMTAAETAYQNKNYDKVVEIYEGLLSSGRHSAELYYNLGNAYYRSGELGRAVLNYERALRLTPRDEAIQHNLGHVNEQLKGVRVGIKRSRVELAWLSVQSLLSSRAWAWFGLALVWLGLGTLGYWWITPQKRTRRRVAVIGVALLLMSSLPFAFGYGRAQQTFHHNEAIVLLEEVSLRAGPEAESKVLQPLYEGAKVRLLDQLGTWYQVELDDTSEGWLPKESVERI